MSDTEGTALSDAQTDALKRAYDLLAEHFEHTLIMVGGDHAKNDNQSFTKGYWHGGFLPAIGLAVEAQRIMTRDRSIEAGPE